MMDKNQILKTDLIEAWERYVNNLNTCDDLALILDSIINDDHIQEFDDVFNRVAWNKAMNELPPTLEEKEKYREKFVQLLAEYENKRKIKTRKIYSRNFRKIWYAAAAALLLGLLIPAINLYLKPKAEQTVQYVEEVTQRGEIKTVFLPDQTEVTLNVGSRIKYPANFIGDERSVELVGEALFDVTSDPERPFIVRTENMNIKVVGTVFDVKEYSDDLYSSVSVASGKVEVGLADRKLMLGKDQQVKMDKATGNVETMPFDTSKYMSWTDGTLYFEGTPIREVVNMLNRHFPQVDIELADNEYSNLIKGKHKSVYVENILESIVYISDLKFKKTGGNKYIVYKE